jgi:hypothetical protein
MHLDPLRQQHSTRTLLPSIASGHHDSRNRMETLGSLMESMRPKTMQAVTAAGVELNVFLLVLA